MDFGWKKIIILAVINVFLIFGIIIWVLWTASSRNNLASADPDQLFPVVLGAGGIITSPPPAFYQERQLYQASIKGLGFGNQNSVSQKLSVKTGYINNPAQGAAQMFTNSSLPSIFPDVINTKLAASADVFVFPPFYVKYLNEMEDIMIADGALKERMPLKTNDQVITFLDSFYDYLIQKGIVPANQSSNLHSGVRRALQLLKDEAARPQSYFNFQVSSKIADSGGSMPQYGLEAFLRDLSLAPIRTAQAQVNIAGFTVTPQMAQQAGNFIGNKLGSFIGGKLGSFIPSSIANQIGNTISSQLGNQLGSSLGGLITTPTSAIDQALRTQMEAEFGDVGTPVSSLLGNQLNSLYGQTLGNGILGQLSPQLSNSFLSNSSFMNDLTSGLGQQFGQFGQQLGGLFNNFSNLSSAFSSLSSGLGNLGNLGNLGSISSLIGGGGGGGSDCYREGYIGPAKHYAQSCGQGDASFAQIKSSSDFFAVTISMFNKLIAVQPAFAQFTGGTVVSPNAPQAGNFIGGQIGKFIGGKLGSYIPSGIANQIGNTIGSQLGSQLTSSLGNILPSAGQALNSSALSGIQNLFSGAGNPASSLLGSQLDSLYGQTIGNNITNQLSSQLSNSFLSNSSFMNDLTSGLGQQFGQFGQQLGGLFNNFSNLSSAFSSLSSGLGNLGNLGNLGSLGNLGNIGSLIGAGGGGSNLPAPCCDCTTGGAHPVPIGCLNKVCPSGPAIWDQASGICGCGQGGGGGGGGGAASGGLPGGGAEVSGLSSVSNSFGGMFGNFASLPGGIISPQMARVAGNFLGGQLGNFIGGQLGNIIPGGIAGQIGNFLGGQLSSQLGSGLSDIVSSFDSGSILTTADLNNAVGTEFTDVSSSIDSQLRDQLNAEYGPIEGQNVANQFDSEMDSIDGQAVQFSDTTATELNSELQTELDAEGTGGITLVDCRGSDCAGGQNIDPRELEVRNKLGDYANSQFGGDYKKIFDAYATNGVVDSDAVKKLLGDAKVSCAGFINTCGFWADAIVKKFNPSGDTISLPQLLQGLGKGGGT